MPGPAGARTRATVSQVPASQTAAMVSETLDRSGWDVGWVGAGTLVALVLRCRDWCGDVGQVGAAMPAGLVLRLVYVGASLSTTSMYDAGWIGATTSAGMMVMRRDQVVYDDRSRLAGLTAFVWAGQGWKRSLALGTTI